MTTIANVGMASFMGQMAASLKSQQCAAVVRETETCLLNNINISSCANFELGCCNDLNSKIITCPNMTTLLNNMGAVITEIHNDYPQAIGYMYEQSGSSSSSAISITNKMQSTVSAQCSAQALINQTVDIPSITAHQCSDVFLNF